MIKKPIVVYELKRKVIDINQAAAQIDGHFETYSIFKAGSNENVSLFTSQPSSRHSAALREHRAGPF